MRVPAAALLLALAVAHVGAVADAAASYAGTTLAQAIERLRRQGLNIIYTSALVHDDMIVSTEPAGGDGANTLHSLLAPFGLDLVRGPRGALVVVRAAGAPPRPVAPHEHAHAERTDAPALDELVVTASRYRVLDRQASGAQALDRAAVARTPHLADDLNRALARLPGAAGGDISARFHVRGGDVDEALVRLDGLELYQPFHMRAFQSLLSIVDANAIDGVDYYAGAFPANYGNRLSAVIDIRSRVPQGPPRRSLGLSFTNAFGHAEGGFAGGEGDWLVAARRGYLDLVLDFVDPGGKLRPTYYDALAKVGRQLGPDLRLSFNTLTAFDRTRFEGDTDAENAHEDAGNSYAWSTLDAELGARLHAHLLLAAGWVRDARNGGFDAVGEQTASVHDERRLRLYQLSQDWRFEASARQRLAWGYDAQWLRADYDYRSSSVLIDPVLVDAPQITDRATMLAVDGGAYAVYLTDRFRIAPALAAELGLRADRESYTGLGKLRTGPRANLLYAVGPRTQLRVAWGEFSQAQRIDELQVEDGVTRYLPAERATHAVVGLEQALADALELRVELYAKRLRSLRPRYENLLDPVELFPEVKPDRVRVAPERARAQGVELTLSRPHGNPSWWISYVYSRVEDRVAGVWTPRSWDQPQALSFDFNRAVGAWDLNVAGIFHSGWPTTAVAAQLETAPDGTVGVHAVDGPRNGERFASYQRLDLRATRHRAIARGTLSWYVEVSNLYDRANPCCVDDLDLRVTPGGGLKVIRNEDDWLPIIPSLGLLWEF